MAGNKTNNSKKKKGNFLPLLVVVIVGFLAYQANPSYWQQGKLFEDLKNAGKQEAPTEQVSKVPEKVDTTPKVDPDASLDGSVKGSKTIPINVNKSVNNAEPTYAFMRSKFKTIYLVYPDNSTGAGLAKKIYDEFNNSDLKDDWRFISFLYPQNKKKDACSVSKSQQFFCDMCDKKICLINPKKQEYIVVGPTAQASLGRARTLKGDW